MEVKNEITYLLIVDYLTRMAADQVITKRELEDAKRLTEIRYRIKAGSLEM